MSAGCQITDRS